jgi:predicted cation transporter
MLTPEIIHIIHLALGCGSLIVIATLSLFYFKKHQSSIAVAEVAEVAIRALHCLIKLKFGDSTDVIFKLWLDALDSLKDKTNLTKQEVAFRISGFVVNGATNQGMALTEENIADINNIASVSAGLLQTDTSAVKMALKRF